MQVLEAEITNVRPRPQALDTSLAGGEARQYEIIRPLGTGGMGTVHEAVTMVDGAPQRVALKRALPHIQADPILRALFWTEARTVGVLDHPGLVAPFDVTHAAATGQFAMEYVDGWTVATLVRGALRKKIGIPRSAALQIAKGAARALHGLHHTRDTNGRITTLVHGDVSPTNIMVSRKGAVKLVDFGLAQLAGAPPIKRQGLLGTPSYMSPEQALRRCLGTASDVFGVGVLLWELTTRCRLFRGNCPFTVALNVARCRIPHPTDIDDDYCEELAALVMCTLEQDPQRRLGNAGQLADALDEYASAHQLDGGAPALARWVNQVMPTRAVG